MYEMVRRFLNGEEIHTNTVALIVGDMYFNGRATIPREEFNMIFKALNQYTDRYGDVVMFTPEAILKYG